jgi:hypothetical protein
MVSTLSNKIKNNKSITDIERTQGDNILNRVADLCPELFFDMDDFFDDEKINKKDGFEITLDLVEDCGRAILRMPANLEWNRQARRARQVMAAS